MRSRIFLGVIAAAALALCLGSAARAEEPLKIRAAWINTPASLLPLLFPKPGIARHDGVSYKLEAIHFASSPTQITAIAANEIDIATLGFSSFPIAVLNAGLTDLRIIADETRDGYEDYGTNHYMVLKDSPVKTIEDLKGKSLAIIGIGAGADIGMRAVLAKHNLLYPRDYTLIEVRLPNMKAMLVDHKVDLSDFTAPFVFDPDLDKIARLLFTMKEGMGSVELSFWVVHKDFLDKHRVALVDLLEDTIRANHWYADPANHAAAVASAAKVAGRPVDQLDWAFTKRDDFHEPNARPDLETLQRNVDTVKALGFIKADLAVAPLADLSLVTEAAQRIK